MRGLNLQSLIVLLLCLGGPAFAIGIEGPVTLPEATSQHTQALDLRNVTGRRYLCSLEAMAVDPAASVTLLLEVATKSGQRLELPVFEHLQLKPEWTGYVDDIVFPEGVERLTGLRLTRGSGEGAVSARNLKLEPEALRFDHRPRPFISALPDWGPTRAVLAGQAELLYRSSLTAVAREVWLPIIFGARSGLALRTVVNLYFDVPSEAGEPWFLAQGHPETYTGTPQVDKTVTHDGKTYGRYLVPTNLYYAQSDAQAMVFLKPALPVDAFFRIGYGVQWEGGEQDQRWLDVQVISVPDGPSLKSLPVAMAAAYPWELPQAPGFADLLRRSGITAVEVHDITGYDDRRRQAIDYLHGHGITPIGSFSPGFWYPYQTALNTNEDMQAKGIDGQPAPTDHGPAACPSYRGELYQKQMELMQDFAKYGLQHVSFDEEFFGPGGRICFCDRCRGLFRRYLAQHNLPDLPMETIATEAAQHPDHAKAWAQFKADLMTEWYRDYRRALEDGLRAEGATGPLHMYATSQTTATGAGEVEFHSIMRDNATRLREGIIQGLLPMPYFYDPYYQGSLRQVGEDLATLQRMWGPSRDGRPTQFPYLLSGGGGMCYVEPQIGLKYQMYEAFMTGGVSGCILWHLQGMDGFHWRHMAEATHALAKVERVLIAGQPVGVQCSPATAAVRALREGQEAALLVTDYGYDPVRVRVEYDIPAGAVVEDAETGEIIRAGRDRLTIDIKTSRARLLWIHPR